MDRDMTPDISATPVNKKGLTKNQQEQLDRFEEMKKNANKKGDTNFETYPNFG